MSDNRDSLGNIFWKSLNQFRGLVDLNSLKKYLMTLIFLKYITEESKNNKDNNFFIPKNCDFDSLLEFKDSNKLGEEINSRLRRIAKENRILDGVINFVDFKAQNIFGTTNLPANIFSNLLVSINSFAVNSNVLSSNNNSIWSDLFEYLFVKIAEADGKRNPDISTPKEITELISKLINLNSDNNNISIYDPTCGSARLLLSLSKQVKNKADFYGQEINSEQVFLAKINLFLHGVNDFHIEGGDVLNSPHFLELNGEVKKFDYVVANPPFNVRMWNHHQGDDIFNRWNSKTGIPPINSGDYAYLLHIVNSLKENGTAACIVTNGVLFRGGSEKNIRKYLVDNGFIKGIIGLPENLFYGTGIPCSILILGNQSNRNNIFIIDASSEFLSERFLNKLLPENINHIADVWESRKEENEFSRLVSYNEILENDYNLNIPRYLVSIEEFSIPKDSKVNTLSNLLIPVPRIRINNEFGKSIKISDLSNDSFLYDIDIDTLTLGEVNRNFMKLETPALLISKRFNKLKPSFCRASSENPVFFSPDIEAFSLLNNSVDLSYLMLQLNSDFVLKQVESLSIGALMPSLSRADLLKIKIVIPNLETQDSIIRQKALAEGARIQSDKSKIETFQLQNTIDTLLKERMNDFQWKLHDIRNGELLNLKGQIVTLEMFADANPTLFDKIVDVDTKGTIHSAIKNIYTSVQKIAVIISDLYDTSDNTSVKEDIDILVFINDFCKNQIKNNGNLFEIDTTDIDKIKNDFKIIDLIISINKKDLQRVFTNIFENAIKHGDFNDSNKVNKIKMGLSLDPKKEIITITVLNNGKPSKINALDYFADGGKAGLTSNTGKGGHIVKVLTERNNGNVFQNNYTIEEADGYTFEVGVQFKYKLVDEL